MGVLEFDNYQLFKKGDIVLPMRMFGLKRKDSFLVTDSDVLLTLSCSARKKMKVSVVYEGPIPAPIAAGSQLATWRVSVADMDDVTIPLYAAQDVEQLGLFRKIGAAVEYLVWGSGG